MAIQKDSVTREQNSTQKTLSHYDAHIIPAETVAREAREGSHFAQVDHDNAKDIDHVHTRDGYTVDQEGLTNNYAVETPMYVTQPGGWRHKFQQNTIGWGALFLFALGTATLLVIMKIMPYVY